MSKRQIVIDAINHKQTEIIPYQLFFTREVIERLRKEFNDDRWYSKLGNFIASTSIDVFENLDNERYKDQFGVIWRKDQKGDIGVVENCVIEVNKLDDYEFPKLNDELVKERCAWFKQDRDYFRMFMLGFSLFERAWTLRGGIENFMKDMIRYPDFVNDLLDRICEYNLDVIEKVLEYSDFMECFRFGDDWGMQKGLLLGYKRWKKIIKPPLAKMYRKAKDAGLYLCQHSCGDNYLIFSDLIELGLDIYETFQPEVYDIEKVKREFGEKLTFYGGISTQSLLPYATSEEVRGEVTRMMNVMGKNGGYIVAPTHTITEDTPTENILAFIDTVQHQK
jgi:uroporphyrinogen decarboxylase